MAITTKLHHFSLGEFHHPELVNDRCAQYLDTLRGLFGQPLVLTDDGRAPGMLPPGASTSSLHFQGQAFDIRSRDWTPGEWYNFVKAAQQLAASLPPEGAGIELELVHGPTDTHCHIGFFLDGRPNRLLIRAD